MKLDFAFISGLFRIVGNLLQKWLVIIWKCGCAKEIAKS